MNETRYFQRFTLAQRFLHGVLAATFLALAFTGIILKFSAAPWLQIAAATVGGFGAILFLHKFSAFLLTVAFLIHVADVGYRIIVKRQFDLLWGPNSMVPNLKDVQDFWGNIKWFLHLGPRPKFDRYAYWDKVDYWGVFWGMAIIGISGYAMWFAPFFGKFLPGSLLNIALLIHGEEAILAVGFIFTIHFFNTHLRPSNFPMDLTIFTGRQSEEQFIDDHPDEYARLAANNQLEARLTEAPPRWMKNFARTMGVTAVVAGIVMVTCMAIAFIKY